MKTLLVENKYIAYADLPILDPERVKAAVEATVLDPARKSAPPEAADPFKQSKRSAHHR
jgi:hypothetical protein